MNSIIKKFSVVILVAAVAVVASVSLPSAVRADDGGYDIGGFDGGGYDIGGYDSYDSGYDIGGYDSYDGGYDMGGYESYDSGYDVGGYDYNGDGVVTETEVAQWDEYTYGGSSPNFGGSSMGGYSYGGSSIGRSNSYGYSYAQPMTFYAPSYRPTPTHTATASNTYNNCVNNSCNNTYIDNSINNSLINSGTIQNSAIATGIDNVATIYPIQAAPVQYPVQYTYSQPSCTITINYNTNNAYGVYSNQLATLTWSATNATYGYISPTVGTVSNYGSMTVYPTSGQVYSMTVYGQGGGTATCRTQTYYAPVLPVAPTPVNPTPYVSLSQIPYTGFDFGTLGNALYWLSLVAFAGALAYLVLYFQGGALAVIGTRGNRVQAEMPRITVSKAPAFVAPSAPAVVEKKEEAVVSPIQFATAKAAEDKMEVKFSKGGEMPRIVISRN